MENRVSSRRKVAKTIALREAKSTISGLSGYVSITIALLAAIWILLIDVRLLNSGGLLVLANPFGPALSVAMLVMALFLAVSAAVSTARDRESGTLEVLFYGPVDEISYLVGKIGGQLLAYLFALPIILAAFVMLSWMTGFLLTPSVLISLVLSLVPAAEIIAFGVLLAIGTNRVRTAVLLLVGVIAVLIGVSIAYSMVLLVPIADPSSPMLPLRDALANFDAVAQWVSPFAWLARIVEAAVAGAWLAVLQGLGIAAAYTVGLVALAAVWMRRRGVYRTGE